MDGSGGQRTQGVVAWTRDTSVALERGSVEPFPPAATAGAAATGSGAMSGSPHETSQTVGASPAAGLVSVRSQAAGALPESAEDLIRTQYRERTGQGAEQPLAGNAERGEWERAGRAKQGAGEEPQESVPMASQQEDPMLVCQEGQEDPMLLSQPVEQRREPSEDTDVAKEPAAPQRLRSLHEGYATMCAELGIVPPAALLEALEKANPEAGDESTGKLTPLALPLAQMSDAVIFSLADFLAQEDAISTADQQAGSPQSGRPMPIDASSDGLAPQGSGAALLHLLRSAGPRLRQADLSNMPLGRDTFRDLFHNGLMAQSLGLAHCRVRKLDFLGSFPHLRELVLDHNPAILGLPKGCFMGAPRLASVSLCATGLHNPWTATAALAALPGLKELRFRRCACCASSTAHCAAAQAEEDASVAMAMAFHRRNVQSATGGAPAGGQGKGTGEEREGGSWSQREREFAALAEQLQALEAAQGMPGSGGWRQATAGEDVQAERRALRAWEESRGRGPPGETGAQDAGTLDTVLRDAVMAEGRAMARLGALAGMPGWAQLLAETGFEDSGPLGLARGGGGEGGDGVVEQGAMDDLVMGDREAPQGEGEEYEEGEEEEGGYEEEGGGEEGEEGEEDFEEVEGGEEEYEDEDEEEEGEGEEEEGEADGGEEGAEEDFVEEGLLEVERAGEGAPGSWEDRDRAMLLIQRSLDRVGEDIPGAVQSNPSLAAGTAGLAPPAGEPLVRQDSDQPMEDAFVEASRARQWRQEVALARAPAGSELAGIRRLIDFGQGSDAAGGGARDGEMGDVGSPEVGEGHAEGVWAPREGSEALLAVQCLALQESQSSTMNSSGSSGLGMRTASTSSSSTSLSSQGAVSSTSRSSSRNSTSSDTAVFASGGSSLGSAPSSGPSSTGSISSGPPPLAFSPLGASGAIPSPPTPILSTPATPHPLAASQAGASATAHGAQGLVPMPPPGSALAPLPPRPPQAPVTSAALPGAGTGQRSGGVRRTRTVRGPAHAPDVARDAVQGSGGVHGETGVTGNGSGNSSGGTQGDVSAEETKSLLAFLRAHFRQKQLRHASPLCSLYLYRQFMITRLPSLEVLDNLAITPEERAQALEAFSVHFEPYAYGLLHTENMLQLLQRRESQTCSPVPGAARSAALRRRHAPGPCSLSLCDGPRLAPAPTATASNGSSSGDRTAPAEPHAVRSSSRMAPWPSRGFAGESTAVPPSPASVAGTAHPAGAPAPVPAPAVTPRAVPQHGTPATFPELAVGPRRMGLAVTAERQRGGKSMVGFKRALGASRVQACTWTSSRPMACNPEGRGTGGATSQRPTEHHRRYRPRQFEYHPTDPHLMVFGTLHGEVVVVNHEAERIVGQVQSIGAPHSILGLCWLNRDPSKLIGGCDNGSIQLYDINHMRASYLASLRPRPQGAAGASGSPGLTPTGGARPGMPATAGQGAGAVANTPPPAAGLAGTAALGGNAGRFGAAPGPVLNPPNTQALGLGAGTGAGATGPLSSWDTVRNPAIYTYEDFEQLTSVHVNCTDDVFVASGYSNHVGLYDVRTGRRLHVFPNLHKEHINVLKFSHHSPHLFATSSFDRDIKLWDARQRIHVDGTNPIYSVRSKRGNVMVCFSPDDSFLLASAIDNEVRQYVASDGRLQMTCDIQPLNSQHNYTRSYYMNGRDYIVSGSCEENIVRICCARTGRRLRDVVLEGKGGKNSLYVQSLRGDPFRDFHLSVLVAYSHPNSRSEIVKVNLVGNSNSGSAHSTDFQDYTMASVGA